MPRLERGLVVLGVLLVVVLPTALHGWPATVGGNLDVLVVVGAGLALLGWRRHPRVVPVVTLGLLLAAVPLPGWFPDSALVLFSAGFALLALAWSGRAAWFVGLCGAAYVVVLDRSSGMDDWVVAALLTLPAYLAGTAFRLRAETAAQLALRARELEEERELFAEIAVRHERARIAAELHDVLGHAVSVMVIQAAAGQRLVDSDPGRARAAFAAISESARQGTQDLDRLVELLGGSGADGGEAGLAELALVDEVVARAAQSGLSVTCRFEGDRDRVPPPVGHLAFRVVQESLTNALRYAPGADVRIVLRVGDVDRRLTVEVENSPAADDDAVLTGTGRGLVGLRERVQALGGTFRSGPTADGGWAVDARLPLVAPQRRPASASRR